MVWGLVGMAPKGPDPICGNWVLKDQIARWRWSSFPSTRPAAQGHHASAPAVWKQPWISGPINDPAGVAQPTNSPRSSAGPASAAGGNTAVRPDPTEALKGGEAGKQGRLPSPVARERAEVLVSGLEKRLGQLRAEAQIIATAPNLKGGALVIPARLLLNLRGPKNPRHRRAAGGH